MKKKPPSGQLIIGVIIILVILAILIPAIIQYTQNESKWTVKTQRTTKAFQLAESAMERGFQKIILSTSTWSLIQAGSTLNGYNLDQSYTDLIGGTYEVRIIQGPGTQQATITGVGRDTSTNEIRAIKAIYSNTAAQAAIFAMGGITLTSNPGVEWGSVLSPAAITTTQEHPRFYSSSSISLDANGASPPNSDNIQWWSYFPNMPPPPQIDTLSYYNEALAQGHVLPGGTYKMKDDICAGAASCQGTYYFTGDTTVKTPTAYISSGAFVVMGNLTMQGSAGDGAYSANIPPDAWKEYGNDWDTYRTDYDGGAPATFPGVTGTYAHGALTKAISNVFVHGFLYIQDAFDINGGGNASIHGSMYLGDPTSLDGSHVKVYYDNSLTVRTKNISLARASWEEIGCAWSGAHPTCP